MSRTLAIALSFCLSLAAFAQHHHSHPFACTERTTKFPLLKDMGNLHHKVKTDNAEAQRYFDQGLTLIYGFNYSGAYASFREAFVLDDKLAMAHWGMALASGANINIDIDRDRMRCAAEHMNQARALKPLANDRDRAYINALDRRYSGATNTDNLRLAIDYMREMQKLAKAYPPQVDPDASTLYAESLMDLRPWRLWTIDGRPYEGTEDIVKILEGVLAVHKDHVGAVHYHLHALEPSPRWKEAAGDAKQLETLVPGSGHLVHMPSHIYLLAREYEAAARMNERAIAVDKEYIQQAGVDGYVGHYLSHNMHFLAVVRTLQGNYDLAIASAKDAAANAKAHPEEPGLEHYMTTPTLVNARFAKWDELLKPENEPGRNLKIAHAMYTWGQAIALAGKGQVAASRQAQGAFKTEMANCAGYLTWGNNPTMSLLNIADLVLSAKIARAEGDTAAVNEILTLAKDAVKELLYDEPPPWFIPLDL